MPVIQRSAPAPLRSFWRTRACSSRVAPTSHHLRVCAPPWALMTLVRLPVWSTVTPPVGPAPPAAGPPTSVFSFGTSVAPAGAATARATRTALKRMVTCFLRLVVHVERVEVVLHRQLDTVRAAGEGAVVLLEDDVVGVVADDDVAGGVELLLHRDPLVAIRDVRPDPEALVGAEELVVPVGEAARVVLAGLEVRAARVVVLRGEIAEVVEEVLEAVEDVAADPVADLDVAEEGR